MRTALVHDWLTGMRGGEKVLEALCELHPDADIITLVHRRGSVSAAIERHHITTSLIQWLPLARTHYRHYLPLFPFAIEQLDLDPYELVISSSHCVAKAVVAPGRARHLCYCHSPMRYAWDQFDAYFGPARVGTLASHWFYRPMLARLARWDASTAHRVHRFLANSQFIAGRIRRYYNRDSTVVYPPVDTTFFHPLSAPDPADSIAQRRGESRSDFLVVSALVPYKRIELAIDACARAGARLRIIGDGPDRAVLERRAGPSIEFLGSCSNERIRDEYRAASAVILPGEEDFGIVPVEAQACGTPVVALGRGGACETVVDGDTGILVTEATAEAFAGALSRAASTRWDAARIRTNAERFSRQRHLDALACAVNEMMAAPAGTRW